MRDRRSQAKLEGAISEGWVKPYLLRIAPELHWLALFSERLRPGETASLDAANVNGWSFASDDLTARDMAEAELPESVFGGISILLKAVKTGALGMAVADRFPTSMIVAGYHPPVSSLRQVLKGE